MTEHEKMLAGEMYDPFDSAPMNPLDVEQGRQHPCRVGPRRSRQNPLRQRV